MFPVPGTDDSDDEQEHVNRNRTKRNDEPPIKKSKADTPEEAAAKKAQKRPADKNTEGGPPKINKSAERIPDPRPAQNTPGTTNRATELATTEPVLMQVDTPEGNTTNTGPITGEPGNRKHQQQPGRFFGQLEVTMNRLIHSKTYTIIFKTAEFANDFIKLLDLVYPTVLVNNLQYEFKEYVEQLGVTKERIGFIVAVTMPFNIKYSTFFNKFGNALNGHKIIRNYLLNIINKILTDEDKMRPLSDVDKYTDKITEEIKNQLDCMIHHEISGFDWDTEIKKEETNQSYSSVKKPVKRKLFE